MPSIEVAPQCQEHPIEMMTSPTNVTRTPNYIITKEPTIPEQPYQTLTRLVQGFSDTNAQTWWSLTGPILGRLMSSAKYDVQTQYACLIFHLYNVVPRLGPAPGTRSNKRWRSFMCDDFSPLEYSWNWPKDQDTTPKIRYSVELIGPNAGTSQDPYNRTETLELCRQLRKDLPRADWKLFDIMCHAFYDKDAADNYIPREGADDDDDNADEAKTSSPSSLFLAFELGPAIATKAYFMPPSPLQPRASALSLLSSAIAQLRASGHVCSGYETLLHFLRTPTGSNLSLVIVAIDCFESTTSRFKIYMRSPATSFASVLATMALGGARPLPLAAVANLRELWYGVLSLPDDFPEHGELESGMHQTSGVLYNFDLALGSESVSPKVYIPLKHYAKSDGDAARGLKGYLGKRGLGDWVVSYMDVLCEGRDLQEARGRQTYIGVSVGKTGELSLCSYIGGGVYT